MHYDGMQEYLENRDDAECNEEVPVDPILCDMFLHAIIESDWDICG